MSLTGGKRKVNKSLKAWVAFVKKVQKEEKLSYKDAIHRAKQRKDKGEKWMSGGATMTNDDDMDIDITMDEMENEETMESPMAEESMNGGKRHRRSARRKSRGRKRSRKTRRHSRRH